jgi:cholesterol oxidase
MAFGYDYLVAGSGVGGAVSALRLAEKGWRDAVVEQGRKIENEDIKNIRKAYSSSCRCPV